MLGARRALGSVVALGDSITDGVGSPFDMNERWPNDLAGRLDNLRGATLAVVDEGIGGNRVLTRLAVLRCERSPGSSATCSPRPASGT